MTTKHKTNSQPSAAAVRAVREYAAKGHSCFGPDLAAIIDNAICLLKRDLETSKIREEVLVAEVRQFREATAEKDAEIQRLREALRYLTAEIGGMIGIEEPSLRQLLGNTNFNCLRDRWLQARAVLSTDASEPGSP